jgi:hypothetical protein
MAWRSILKTQSQGEPHANRLLRFVPVVVAALCILLPLLPWTIRNWRTFHVFQPLSPRSTSDPGEQLFPGFPRWYRSWAIDFASTSKVYWNYGGDRIVAKDLPARAYTLGCNAYFDTSSSDLRRRTVALLDDYNQSHTLSSAVDTRFDELARERVQASPLCYYIGLPVARLLNMLLRPRTETMEVSLEWWRWREHPGQTMLAGALAALNLAYLSLAVFGFLVWRDRGWLGAPEIAWAMAASILLRCALLLTLDNSEPRYTLEFYPVLLVWAGGLFAQFQRSADVPDRWYKGES